MNLASGYAYERREDHPSCIMNPLVQQDLHDRARWGK
jgi:hypothetical protein